MRLGLVTDIHGNFPALQAVLADAERAGVDGFICAGDMIDGPQPMEVVRALQFVKAAMIRGNREAYVLACDSGDVPDSWRTSDQWASLRWLYRRLDSDAFDLFRTLPEQRVIEFDGFSPIHIAHGAPQAVSALLLPDGEPATLAAFERAGQLGVGYLEVDLATALAQVTAPVLVCGHSHLPWQRTLNGRLAVNPGSVGATLTGDPAARYAILTWKGGGWQAEHRAVDYDLAALEAACRATGFLAEGGAFARSTLLAAKAGRNIVGAFVGHYTRLAAEAGLEDLNEIPNSIWHLAAETFDWDSA